jgi:hypothetical protein
MSPILGLRCETRLSRDKAETPESGVVVAILDHDHCAILVLHPDGRLRQYYISSVTMLEQPTRRLGLGSAT